MAGVISSRLLWVRFSLERLLDGPQDFLFPFAHHADGLHTQHLLPRDMHPDGIPLHLGLLCLIVILNVQPIGFLDAGIVKDKENGHYLLPPEAVVIRAERER